MSRIVIDARLWSESGIGRYIRNLVNHLQILDRSNEYFILLLKKDYDKLVYHSKNFHKVLADFRWYGFWEQLILPRVLNSLKPDLVHFPHFNVPILYRGKFVVTIHDLIHQHFQMKRSTTHDPLTHKIKKFGYHKVFKHAVIHAQKILTPSKFVKNQITGEWKIDENKVIVTPEAVESNFINLLHSITKNEFEKVSKKFQFQKPYLFYVGNAHPHKNIPMLINAFRKIKKQYPQYSLILSGPGHHFWQQIQKETNQEGVLFTGFIPERELVTLYKNATVFIMPSMEEGFGIPLLEAMSCNCPVISSNAGSLPEIGGDAAIYFDPKNENNMIQKISRVLKDSQLRKELITKGQKRYKQFSWAKLARQTLEIYQSY